MSGTMTPFLNTPSTAGDCPPGWGEIIPGSIYRSSYPQPEHVAFLATKQLRTILILVDTEPSQEYHDFIRSEGICLKTIVIPANTDGIKIKEETMQQAIQLLADKRLRPLLVHCNKGKHRTGCVTACYRKKVGISLPDILNEYHHYAKNKARAWDETFVRQFYMQTRVWDVDVSVPGSEEEEEFEAEPVASEPIHGSPLKENWLHLLAEATC